MVFFVIKTHMPDNLHQCLGLGGTGEVLIIEHHGH